MRLRLANFVVAVFAVCAIPASAAPKDSKLISMVPPGAQIVSGFENKPNKVGGPLLMTTVNNVLDLDDLRSLSGVDPKRGFSEVIEVTFAPAGTALNEHLLLSAGKFQREAIFRAAQLNGATSVQYLAETVLVVEPFSREKAQMKDTRWLAILDDKIALFGTPWMVQQALNRFENRTLPDPILMTRLALFRHDVDCWNVLTSLPRLQQNVFVQSRSPLSALFDGAELMMVGVRFDSKVRVDFMLHASQDPASLDVKQKADQISRVFAPSTAGDDAHLSPLKDLQLDEKAVRASVVLSDEEFVSWKSGQVNRDRETIKTSLDRAKAESLHNSALKESAQKEP